MDVIQLPVEWPIGGGEMARRIRSHDWASTSLGPNESWPQSLRSAVDIMLAIPGAATILWGPAHVQLYNDAYIGIAKDRHPMLLGRPVAENWPDAYEGVIAPLLADARAGRGTRLTDLPVELRGPSGQIEERVFDTDWSPIRDESGAVAGVLQTLAEVTDRHRAQASLRGSEERQGFLLRLADALRPLAEAAEIQATTTRMLGAHLGVDRAMYAEVGGEPGAETGIIRGQHVRPAHDGDPPPAPFPERFSYGPFGAHTMAARYRGEPLIVGDVLDDPAFDEAERGAWIAQHVRAAVVAPLAKGGRLVAELSVHCIAPRAWTDAEVSLISEVAERTWAAAERARAEAALRESEQEYRSLFETMGQGYCLLELIRDETGRAVDQLYLELNPAFERLFGITAAEAKGLKASEVFPFVDPLWHERFDEVASTGTYKRFEHQHGPLHPWFEVFVYPRGGDRVVVLYEEITDRKHAEIALRESEERQAFLLALGDAMRAESAADDKIAVAARLLGKKLNSSRVLYAEYDHEKGVAHIFNGWLADGAQPFPSALKLEDFEGDVLNDLREGRVVRVDDVGQLGAESGYASIATLGVQALLSPPLLVDGKLKFNVSIHQHEPRHWSDDEVALVQEVSERLWAEIERARAEAALRESEEQLRTFGEASSDVLWIRDARTLQWTHLSPAFETIYGMRVEEALTGETFSKWADLVVEEDRGRAMADIHRVIAGERITFEYRVRRPDGGLRWLRNTDFPMCGPDGTVQRIGGVGQDVTELKQVEAALREKEGRLRTLMEGIPQLVWRSREEGQWTWASPQWRDFTDQSQEQSRGLGWLDAVHPDDREATMRAWEAARQHGMFDAEYRVRRASDGAYLWHHTRSLPIRDEGGRILEWLGTTTDVQELKELQEHQAVLVAELQHRTRNLLGVVRSISDKTARSSADLPDFRARFRDRLAALSRVQGLLSRLNDVDRVTFDELIRTELSALDGGADRVALEGPPGVRLRSSTVQTLAMALHELATNAVKYGAFRQPSGRLSISWSLEPSNEGGKPWLHIDWRESGVEMPSGPSPRCTGQGRELIERALPYQLKAKTSYTMGADGVHCTISVPVSASTVGAAEYA